MEKTEPGLAGQIPLEDLLVDGAKQDEIKGGLNSPVVLKYALKEAKP